MAMRSCSCFWSCCRLARWGRFTCSRVGCRTRLGSFWFVRTRPFEEAAFIAGLACFSPRIVFSVIVISRFLVGRLARRYMRRVRQRVHCRVRRNRSCGSAAALAGAGGLVAGRLVVVRLVGIRGERLGCVCTGRIVTAGFGHWVCDRDCLVPVGTVRLGVAPAACLVVARALAMYRLMGGGLGRMNSSSRGRTSKHVALGVALGVLRSGLSMLGGGRLRANKKGTLLRAIGALLFADDAMRSVRRQIATLLLC
mmetsp:Transcript_40390/g.111309  ORF Transcript_40390/g.111309 Transcript_40390/m.111309 type:complete len:253 (-) Transcript_40390:750-1508(-)